MAHKRFFSRTGKPVRPVYKVVYDDHGVKDLVVAKQPEEWYAMIQSHRESTDIHAILARFAKTGDLSLLNQRTGEYLDLTSMPSNIHEYYQAIAAGEDFFKTLSPEVKAQFNNSVSQFMCSIGSEKFNSIFTHKLDSVPVVKDGGDVNAES